MTLIAQTHEAYLDHEKHLTRTITETLNELSAFGTVAVQSLTLPDKKTIQLALTIQDEKGHTNPDYSTTLTINLNHAEATHHTYQIIPAANVVQTTSPAVSIYGNNIQTLGVVTGNHGDTYLHVSNARSASPDAVDLITIYPTSLDQKPKLFITEETP